MLNVTRCYHINNLATSAEKSSTNMRKKNKKIKIVLTIVSIIITIIFCTGYFGLKYLQHQLEKKITGCELESTNFLIRLPFEYINSWIVIKVKVAGSEKEFPFIFDTGAQTVLLDSLLNEIGPENYQSFTLSDKSDSAEHAFNNELISLHQLSIGEVDFKDIGAISANNSKWGMLNCVSSYGIVGYNILQTFCTQIDYKKGQITLTDNVEKLPNYSQIQWIVYKPSIKQETPIIEAAINDSIKIDLFFDTGYSGGINLNSSKLYDIFVREQSANTLKYFSKPSIRIRGENDEIKESIILNTSNFFIGDIISKNITIGISDVPESEFDGLIGNKYFENFIITLDYKNKRIGFIQQQDMTPDNSTFGVSYVASKNKITVSSVFENSEAYNLGIRSGNELYSINGVKVSDLNDDDFCKIYRNEYKLQDSQDSILTLEIFKDEKLIEYVLNKYKKF